MLNARIDIGGALEVERVGGYKATYCPYGRGGELCATWCPLFGEPQTRQDNTRLLEICDERAFWITEDARQRPKHECEETEEVPDAKE